MPDFMNPRLLLPFPKTPLTMDDPSTGGIYGQGASRMGNQGPIIEAGWPGGTIRMNPMTPGQQNPILQQSIQQPQVPFDQAPDISQTNIVPGAQGATTAPEDDIVNIVNKLFTPSHEIADKFNEVWNQMPKHEKPSFMRRVVASMVGGGKEGTKGADAIINDPYNEARGEWMDKLKMLQPLLGDERYQNTNERLMASSAASQQMNQRKLDETERKNKAAEADKDARTEIAADRAATYKYKSEHPGEQLVEDEDGQLMAVNKADGSMHYVLRPDGTPVKSLKNLNAADKQANDIKGRKEIAAIQGANQIKAAAVRGTEARKTEDVKIAGRKDVASVKRDASGKIVSVTTNVYDADGNITGTKTESTTTTPVKENKEGKVDIPSNVGKVKMSTPDGRIIMVPMDKVAEAEQRGAKRVK